MIGAGKYNDEATIVRAITGGGVILIVVDGCKGNGFSAQLTIGDQLRIPAMLRDIADGIEAAHKSGGL
jgi:hypothetical protein